MKQNQTALVVILLVIIGVLPFLNLTAQESTREEITLVGIITDHNELLTENGKLFEIGPNTKGSELAELVGAHVSVKGKMLEFGEKRLILVISYKILGANKTRTG